MTDDRTRVDDMTARLKNHPVVSVLIVLGLIVIAISTFTDSVTRLVQVVGLFPSTNRAEVADSAPDVADKAADVAASPVEITITAAVVRLRWSSTSFWHPNLKIEHQNELRLPLFFKRIGALPAIVERVRVLMDSDGGKSTWEGTYEVDNLPLIPNAPVAPQILQHRTQLLPFALAESNPIVSKTIDFVPIDHPDALKPGTYKSTLQVKQDSSGEWLNVSTFAFTIPSGFQLHGRDASGIEFYVYDYWQEFELMQGR